MRPRIVIALLAALLGQALAAQAADALVVSI
jgi:hypothetical protein